MRSAGANGICQAVARAWVQAGAAGIVLVGRKAETLNITAESIAKASKSVPTLVEPTDISDESSVKSLFEKVKARFGKAHVLVNSAGSMGGGPVGDVPVASWWADFVSTVFQTSSGIQDTLLTNHFLIGKQR